MRLKIAECTLRTTHSRNKVRLDSAHFAIRNTAMNNKKARWSHLFIYTNGISAKICVFILLRSSLVL